MTAFLFLLKNGAALLVVYYIIKHIWRLWRLQNDLGWIPGPTYLFCISKVIGLDQVGFTKLIQENHIKYGPIVQFWVGIDPVINLKDPDLMQALSNTGKKANKSIEYRFFETFCGLSLLTSAGDIWYRKRKLLTPCFHYEILDSFAESMNVHAVKFVNYLSKLAESGREFNFLKVAKLCTLDILMDTTMGLNVNALENENNSYVKAAGSMRGIIMTRGFSPFIRNDFFYNFSNTKKMAIETHNTLCNFVREVIRKRKEYRSNKSSEDDQQREGRRKKALLDMFLDLNDDTTQISDDEIEDEVNTFIFAGHDTASAAFSYTVYLMGRHQEIQERVYEELSEKMPKLMETGLTQADLNKLEYMDRCIKESLRMYPPVPLIGKILNEPLKTDKGTIPANVNITQNIFCMHNDEKLFPQPNIYDPDRFLPEDQNRRHPYSYIPFGSGARNCIGQRFALNEVKILLAYVLMNYKIESIQSPEDLKIGCDIVLTPFNGIIIKLQKR